MTLNVQLNESAVEKILHIIDLLLFLLLEQPQGCSYGCRRRYRSTVVFVDETQPCRHRVESLRYRTLHSWCCRRYFTHRHTSHRKRIHWTRPIARFIERYRNFLQFCINILSKEIVILNFSKR